MFPDLTQYRSGSNKHFRNALSNIAYYDTKIENSDCSPLYLIINLFLALLTELPYPQQED